MSLLKRVEHRIGSGRAQAYIDATCGTASEYALRMSGQGAEPVIMGDEPVVRIPEDVLRRRLRKVAPPRQIEILALDEQGRPIASPVKVRKWFPSRPE